MSKPPDVYLEMALLALQRVARQFEIAGDALGQLRRLDAELFVRIPDGDLVVAFRTCSRMAPRLSIMLEAGGAQVTPNRRWVPYFIWTEPPICF